VPLVAGLFLVFQEASIAARLAIAAIGLGILWAAFRFLRALFAVGARAGVRREGSAPTRPALALPGLVGFGTCVACVGLELLGLERGDRTSLYILALALLPLLALGAIAGLLAAVDRQGPYRLLAVVSNGAYLVLAVVIVWRFLSPVA
jgi:hypothetical protein